MKLDPILEFEGIPPKFPCWGASPQSRFLKSVPGLGCQARDGFDKSRLGGLPPSNMEIGGRAPPRKNIGGGGNLDFRKSHYI